MRYLMHRNALLTIVKNYEEDVAQRVLPLALFLAIRRAVRCSGVSKESFYMWSDVENRLEQGDPSAQKDLLDCLNHLVAVEDVLQSLPHTLSKRREIQSRRKVSDREILGLFEDPLRPIVEDADYIAKEIEFLQLLELDRLFQLDDYQHWTRALPADLQLKVTRLKDELKGMQWLEGQAAGHPPRVPKGRVGNFLMLCRSLGLRSALGHSLKKLSRGF